jgi:restriction system protein
MFGGQQRYEAACQAAREEFGRAQADHRHREAQRHRQVAEARQAHDRKVADAQREVAAHSAHIEEMQAGLREHDRYAVSEYVQIILDRSLYPTGFPSSAAPAMSPNPPCWLSSGTCPRSTSSPRTKHSGTSRPARSSSRYPGR